MSNTPTNILGMKPGDSIEMERHGELGRLYNPVNLLSRQELILYSDLYKYFAQKGKDTASRDEFIERLEIIANSTISDDNIRKASVANVIAYADELVMIQSSGPH